MLCAMPIVSTPDSSIVPPTTIRLTFGLPHGSASSLLFRTFSLNRVFRPLSIRSCLMFSVTPATTASISSSSWARVMPHLARNADSGLSVHVARPAEDGRC